MECGMNEMGLEKGGCERGGLVGVGWEWVRGGS